MKECWCSQGNDRERRNVNGMSFILKIRRTIMKMCIQSKHANWLDYVSVLEGRAFFSINMTENERERERERARAREPFLVFYVLFFHFWYLFLAADRMKKKENLCKKNDIFSSLLSLSPSRSSFQSSWFTEWLLAKTSLTCVSSERKRLFVTVERFNLH